MADIKFCLLIIKICCLNKHEWGGWVQNFRNFKVLWKLEKTPLHFSMQYHKIMVPRAPVKKIQKACNGVIFKWKSVQRNFPSYLLWETGRNDYWLKTTKVCVCVWEWAGQVPCWGDVHCSTSHRRPEQIKALHRHPCGHIPIVLGFYGSRHHTGSKAIAISGFSLSFPLFLSFSTYNFLPL